jgi:hypothetical protein
MQGAAARRASCELPRAARCSGFLLLLLCVCALERCSVGSSRILGTCAYGYDSRKLALHATTGSLSWVGHSDSFTILRAPTQLRLPVMLHSSQPSTVDLVDRLLDGSCTPPHSPTLGSGLVCGSAFLSGADLLTEGRYHLKRPPPHAAPQRQHVVAP